MNDNIKIAAGLALIGLSVVVTVKDYLKIKRTEEALRDQIDAAARVEIASMWKSAGVIEEKIRRGDYDGRTVEDVLVDLRFQNIIDQSE